MDYLFAFIIVLMITGAGGGATAATVYHVPWLACLAGTAVYLGVLAWITNRHEALLYAVAGTVVMAGLHYLVVPFFLAGGVETGLPDWMIAAAQSAWPTAIVSVITIWQAIMYGIILRFSRV